MQQNLASADTQAKGTNGKAGRSQKSLQLKLFSHPVRGWFRGRLLPGPLVSIKSGVQSTTLVAPTVALGSHFRSVLGPGGSRRRLSASGHCSEREQSQEDLALAPPGASGASGFGAPGWGIRRERSEAEAPRGPTSPGPSWLPSPGHPIWSSESLRLSDLNPGSQAAGL